MSKLSKQFGVTLPDGVKKAALNAVDGSASSGLATIEEVQEAQLVTVLANLPDLAKGEKYAARLSGGDKPVVLGSLSIAKGGWMIEQRVNADPSVYKTVEVLKGASVVLRGKFGE